MLTDLPALIDPEILKSQCGCGEAFVSLAERYPDATSPNSTMSAP